MSHEHQWSGPRVIFKCQMCAEHVPESTCPQCGSRCAEDLEEWVCVAQGCRAQFQGRIGHGAPPTHSQSQSQQIDLPPPDRFSW